MARFLTFSTGPRAKWVVAAVWLVGLFAIFATDLPTKFSEAEDNESTSFLPGDAESTAALAKLEEIQDGEQAAIVVVYRREGGLQPADQRYLTEQRDALNAAMREYPQVTPFGEPQIGPRGDAALLIGQLEGDGQTDTFLPPMEDVREIVTPADDGMEAAVTGPAGFAADAIEVFESIDGTLVLAAVSLVFVLLILIYRSHRFFLIPLGAVGVAEITTRAFGFGLTELGVTVNGQSSAILSVLVLGAGTDYALLLVSRYREELRKHEDKHEAAALAMRNAGPAILASGGTVILGLLCLTLAEVNGTAGLGPIGALGIAVAMLTMLTLLPALLVIFGRKAFKRPRFLRLGDGIPRYGDASADETHGAWRRVGERVALSPRRVWIGAAGLLVVMSLGLLTLDTGLTTADSYRSEVESVTGQELISQSFPGGANAPTDVIVPEGADVAAVADAVAGVDGVADVREVERGAGSVLLAATLEPDPYSTEAYDLIPLIRDAAKRAGGEEVLVGGASAVERDVRVAAGNDTLRIPPIALVVIFLVLVALLRAIVVPLLLMGTVVLSFAASLGFSLIVFDVIFGFPGIDPSLPLFAFIFLVALGVDYNIFLMARAREETARWGTRHGMVRALAVTGAVITSAGIVLAGTFSVLAVLPLVFLTEIGFVIAFGVLLDTFLVRSVLVPALVLDIGPRVWWPSRLARAEEHDDLVEDPKAADRRATPV
jgi:putative drug exporter of the RND superfamily